MTFPCCGQSDEYLTKIFYTTDSNNDFKLCYELSEMRNMKDSDISLEMLYKFECLKSNSEFT